MNANPLFHLFHFFAEPVASAGSQVTETLLMLFSQIIDKL